MIVTGARPQVSTLLRQAGIKEEFRDDLRITSKEALQVGPTNTRIRRAKFLRTSYTYGCKTAQGHFFSFVSVSFMCICNVSVAVGGIRGGQGEGI